MRDNYPTSKELREIKKWPIVDLKDCKKLLLKIENDWVGMGYGTFRHHGDTFRITTGGWSGNEDIVRALQANRPFWSFSWYSSTRGGLYIFRVPKL